jgi:hypothetical protein
VADLSFASVAAEDAGDGYLHHRLAMYVNIRLSPVATLFASAKLDHTWSMWILLVHSKLQMEVSCHREL